MKKSTKLCIILVSACLALALLAGALLVMPMLTADDPVDTHPPALTDTEGAGSLYVEDTTSRDEESRGPSEVVHDDNVRFETVNLGAVTYFVTYFDCLPGETVEVRADTECLKNIKLLHDDKEFQRELFYAEERPNCALLNMDPFESCLQVTLPFQNGQPNDTVLEFTIYDEEKRVTGIGCFLVANSYPQTEEEIALTPITFLVTRSAVLGSVRFTDPDAVTGEQVQTLFEEIHAKTDEVRESLDFTPKTPYEVKLKAEGEICRQFVDRRVGLGSSSSNLEDFSIFRVKVYAENGIDLEREHRYVIMNDGSWFEMQFHQGCHSTCHMDELCPNPTGGDPNRHGLTVGCHVLALDGSVFEVQAYTAEDGSEREKLVQISDEDVE